MKSWTDLPINDDDYPIERIKSYEFFPKKGKQRPHRLIFDFDEVKGFFCENESTDEKQYIR